MKQKAVKQTQLRRFLPSLCILYEVLIGYICIALIFAIRYKIDISVLIKDPTALLDAPSYLGFLSNVGILLWCSAATICFFSSLVLRKKGLSLFLFMSGLITSILLLDDLFLLHEGFFHHYLGIPEEITFLIYAVIFGGYLLVFRETIRKTEYLLLVIAIGWFGASIFIDLSITQAPKVIFVEDVLKQFGIVSWLVYFGRTSLKEIRKSPGVPG